MANSICEQMANDRKNVMKRDALRCCAIRTKRRIDNNPTVTDRMSMSRIEWKMKQIRMEALQHG